jgi:oligoendopeptidase F
MTLSYELDQDQSDLEQRWDLTRLYASPSDPRIDGDLKAARRKAQKLRSNYIGKVAELPPADVRKLIDGLDEIAGLLNKLFSYAYLLFSADTQTEDNKKLYARIQGDVPSIRNETVFFDLELQRMPENAFQKLMRAAELTEYHDHLGRIRRVAAHALDELAEKIISLKDSTGSQAWTQLYFETTADFRIKLDMPGGAGGHGEYMTLSQAYAVRETGSRAERKAAFDQTLQIHAEHGRGLTFVFNALFENWRHMMGLRNYDHPLAPLLVEENLRPAVIETLLSTVESNYGLVHRYYRAKAQVLGIEDFAGHDIRASYGGSNSFISFEEGRDIVLDTFENFSPRLGTIARGFFEDRYIDALSRSGKRAGAYCLSSGPVFHPFLFLNYNYTLKDVIVMAHEMGHGVHNVVVADHQTLTNCDRVTMFMETPSTFAETLTFQRLLAREMNPEIRRQLLGSQIEAAMLKIYKSVAVTRFQLNAYERRKSSVVPSSEYCRLWGEQLDAMFGDAVARGEWDDWEWVTFHHTLNYPFYDYAYSFGQLLVYALMRQHQQEGEAFVPKYMKLLEAGTSITIGPLLEMVGVDLHDPAFWQAGIHYLEEMVAEFEDSVLY